MNRDNESVKGYKDQKIFYFKSFHAKPQSFGHKAQRDSRGLSDDYDLVLFPAARKDGIRVFMIIMIPSCHLLSLRLCGEKIGTLKNNDTKQTIIIF